MLARRCHLDRARRSEATEDEWRDPEDASPAMPIRGVLSRRRMLYCRTHRTRKAGETPASGKEGYVNRGDEPEV